MTPSSLARRRSRTISFSVSAGRSVVRATSAVTFFSLSPHFPLAIQVSTMRCAARGATAGRISSVNRAMEDRTPAVFVVSVKLAERDDAGRLAEKGLHRGCRRHEKGREGIVARKFPGILMLIQSNGGLMTSTYAKKVPVHTINSGLVGGILAVQTLGEILGIPNLIRG